MCYRHVQMTHGNSLSINELIEHGAHGILSMSLENSNNISAFNAVDIQK